jgi:hypothetical protein
MGSSIKCIFIFFVIFGIKLSSIGQNLEYSQVLTYSGNINGGTSLNGPVFTVPAGKVWKVESVNIISDVRYKLNGFSILNQINGNGGGTPTLATVLFPFWLKPGDTIQPYLLSSSVTLPFFISIIEFTTP